LPGDARDVLLEGHGSARAHYYYLLTRFDGLAEERDLGFDSEGAPRRHDHPCRYQSTCPGGGRAINPGVNWAMLHGDLPADQLALPVFTATNMDGTARTEADLVGHPTVMWFYPAAATGG
jgi:hypothetical protein